MNEIEKLRTVKQLEAEYWKDSKKMEVLSREIVRLLEEILSNDPTNSIALTDLGTIYCNQGKHEEALVLLKKVEAMHSDDRNLYYNLGVVLVNLGQHTESKKYFKTSHTMQSDELTFEAYIDFHGL